MVPSLGRGSSRAFSTTSVRKWGYSFAQALTISGPHFPKTAARTQVAMIPGHEATKYTLPVALRHRDPPRLKLPDMRGVDSGLLDRHVEVMKSEFQSTMVSEADVIEEAGPFFFHVAAYLAPYYLRRYGLKGKLDYVREDATSASMPDVIFRYEGRPILVLDYKGPNCIFEDEILACCATSVDDALERLPPPAAAAISSSKSQGKGKATASDSHSRKTSSLASYIHKSTQAILKEGLKYANKWGVSTVLFYDYDYLLAMRPPKGLGQGNNLMLMDVTICPERRKSTEDGLVAHPDSHAVVLLRYIIMAVQECEEKRASS